MERNISEDVNKKLQQFKQDSMAAGLSLYTSS